MRGKVTGELSSAEEDYGLSMALRKLLNSVALKNLSAQLSYLSEKQILDLMHLIQSNKVLFKDVPSCTTLLKRDIEVGDSQPIKQLIYRVNPDKFHSLKFQVDYMMQNNIAEPSCSCSLLTDKANGDTYFCTDLRKKIVQPNMTVVLFLTWKIVLTMLLEPDLSPS